MARISYRNKIRLKKLLRALLILAGCLLVVSIVMTIYLEPYILYDRDGAHLSLSQETVEPTVPSASQPRPVVENPQIIYSQGAPVEKSIQEMGGYYITTAMLQKPEAVFEEIKAIQEPCAVMIQLKSIFGNFYYSSSIAGAPKADVAVSVIDEMPPGRKPVRTTLHTPNRMGAVYKFMREEIAKGRQVFVVYPMIYENEKLDLQNMERGYEEIVKAFPLPQYKCAIVHGQQTSEVKNFNMDAFAAGRANILVSTTVIEVGVDVPNASVMVIMSAERFGLSQLHQLRGRVGRGAASSHCILIRDYKCSKEAIQRLELMCSTENGFEIAAEDMKMRGPGDLEGTQQSGLPISLNIASLAKDGKILTEARAYAQKVLDKDPKLEAPENAKLLRELRKEKYQIKDYSRIS